jgi:hypothetical protein
LEFTKQDLDNIDATAARHVLAALGACVNSTGITDYAFRQMVRASIATTIGPKPATGFSLPYIGPVHGYGGKGGSGG